VSLYVVQGLLGHLHARTTQRYAHLTRETLADAADLIQDIVRPVFESDRTDSVTNDSRFPMTARSA
ncbi:MAG TPA: hypothetical protein VKG24_30690, partial [Pseudolabrys sp.]|nr:hypothetical protein [Pseudolabrys sp.]